MQQPPGPFVKSADRDRMVYSVNKMTICIGVVDEMDVVLVTDGRLTYKDEPFSDEYPKSLRLNDSLAVAFASQSLGSVRCVLKHLVPDFDWPENGDELLPAWEKSDRNVSYGYRNAKGRITKAIRAILKDPEYEDEIMGTGILLAGKARGTPVLARWDTDRGDLVTETNTGRKIVGMYLVDKEQRTEFYRLADGDETTRYAEVRLARAIEYCVDLGIDDVGGSMFVRRLTKKFDLRPVPPGNSPAQD